MTLFSFLPLSAAPFQFQPTLDGSVYNVVVTWNLFGRRYYVNIYQLDGTLVACLPMVGSAGGVNIQSIAWSSGKAIVTTQTPHGYRITSTVAVTISGCAPAAFNGEFDCVVTGPNTFFYLLADDPGTFTSLGVASYDISLTDGYFASTLVFREAAQQFEVAP